MKLAERQHRLAVGLLVKRHRGAEAVGVVRLGRAVVDHDPLVRHDLQEAHQVRETLLAALEHAHHVEPPEPALADIGLVALDAKPGRAIPFGQGLRIHPGGEHLFARMVEQLHHDDLAIERPGPERVSHVLHRSSPLLPR